MYKNFLEKLLNLRMLEGDGGGGTGGDGTGGDGSGQKDDPPKTFTQEDLNRIAAQEKRQGASSILKALGFESEEEAKNYLESKRKEDEDKKGDLEKAQEAEKAAKAEKKAAEAKAELLERKYKVVAMGVPSENVDDIVVLANAKVGDDKTFETALEDIKKAYPTLFSNNNKGGKGGTGSDGNPPGGGGGSPEKSMGKRLAEQRKSSQTKDDTYFTR